MSVADQYRPTLVATARKRSLREGTLPNTWVVTGEKRFGDKRRGYSVSVSNGEWWCDCFNSDHGEYRRRSTCSHVIAAMLRAEEGGTLPAVSKWGARGSAPSPPTPPHPQGQIQQLELKPTPRAKAAPRRKQLQIPRQVQRPLRRNEELAGLPEWAEDWRAHQAEAVEATLNHFADGKRVAIVQAPTGAGKSTIAEAVRLLMGARGVYLANTIQLQQQLVDPRRGFPYAAEIKGRANYATGDFPELFYAEGKWRMTAASCDMGESQSCERCPDAGADELDNGAHCSLCHDECPYLVAKQDAIISPLAVLNYAYFLAESNLGKGNFVGRDLVVADEVDALDNILSGHVEFYLSPRRQRMLDIEPPISKTVPDSWPDWAERHVVPKIARAIKRVPVIAGISPHAIEARQERQSLERLLEQARGLARGLREGQWVYDYESTGRRAKDVDGPIIFRPVYPGHSAASTFWRHGDRFLIMSATVLSAEQLATDLGLQDDEWGFHDVPSTFDPLIRPMNVYPAASMTDKNKLDAWPRMAATIRVICDNFHADDRVLVHTVSYPLNDYLFDQLRDMNRPVFTYHSSDQRLDALEKYRANPRSVLFAPSFDRGISLDDDQCRGVIIAKIPFPYLGDRVVSARMHDPVDGQVWYTRMAVQSLIQSTGRATRHEDDPSTTWILDSQFAQVYRRWSHLFPQWWKDALQWAGLWRPIIEREVKTALSQP